MDQYARCCFVRIRGNIKFMQMILKETALP